MQIEEVKQTFRGPMIAVITHLNQDLSIDHEAIRANINYVIEHGFGRGHGARTVVAPRLPAEVAPGHRAGVRHRPAHPPLRRPQALADIQHADERRRLRGSARACLSRLARG